MKNNASEIFAQRLNEALKAAGYSQSALARATGVTPQAVQRWGSGLNIPLQGHGQIDSGSNRQR